MHYGDAVEHCFCHHRSRWPKTDCSMETFLSLFGSFFGLGVRAWRLIRRYLFPRPVVVEAISKAPPWRSDPHVIQWQITIRLRRGLLVWKNTLSKCRLYLIRRDWGPLDSPPEGIWLKWIESGIPIRELEISMRVGFTYEAIAVVRDDRDGMAYIANERFIETNGVEKKWLLKRDQPYSRSDIERFTFRIEVGVDNIAWKSKHYYAISVPPVGVSNDEFKLEALHERRPA